MQEIANATPERISNKIHKYSEIRKKKNAETKLLMDEESKHW